MTKFEKLTQKILEGRNVSYEEAQTILFKLGFGLEIKGSHHVFRKKGYTARDSKIGFSASSKRQF